MRALRPTRPEAVAALTSAALFALSFPPFPFVIPVFLCLIPLAVLIARAADGKGSLSSAARAGFWFGVLGYGCNLYWIAVALSLFTKLAIAGYLASLLWLAPFMAATAAALFVARRATRWPFALLLPVVWTASELVLNYLADLSFPWLPLALAISPLPVMAQIADLSGVRVISFWIAATSGLMVDGYLLRSRRAFLMRLAGAVLLASGVAAYGAWRMRTTTLTPLARIAVVQPNIPQDDKLRGADRDAFVGMAAALTREVYRASDPALVIWPETAMPGFLAENPQWSDTLRALARVERAPLLFGTVDLVWRDKGDYDYYNAAMLADSAGEVGGQPAYRKAYLVPIVERVPFINPQWFAGIDYFGGFGRGTSTTPFRLPFGEVGVLICYESIFPQLSREFRREGADLLVNITNDAWFGRSTAPYQHHAHLALRAIENRIGILRSANTGISGYIDPLGRVRDATELFVPATRSYMAETTSLTTLYVRLGDWLGVLCLLATIAVVGVDWRRRRGESRTVGKEVPNYWSLGEGSPR